MEYGCMGKLDDAGRIREAGFESLELDLRELMKLDAPSFLEKKARLLDSGLSFPVCSWIFPVDLNLNAPGFHKGDWYDYISRGADRCAALGVHIWPFGTGKGRSIKPENGEPEAQKNRVREFLFFLDQILQPRDIQTAIEPLGPANSNYIATLAEADALRQDIGSRSIKLMCDLRHMVWSQDSFSSIAYYGKQIIHCHIDYPLGDRRLFPSPDDGYDYSPYLCQIRQLPCQRLSFEAIHAENTLPAIANSLSYIKSLCESGV